MVDRHGMLWAGRRLAMTGEAFASSELHRAVPCVYAAGISAFVGILVESLREAMHKATESLREGCGLRDEPPQLCGSTGVI